MRYFISWLLLSLMVFPPAVISDQNAETYIITPAEALERSINGSLVLVDIRSEQEWLETGIGRTAKTVSMHEPDGPEGFITRLLAELDADKTKPVGLICATGVRSARIFRFLRANGFSNVYDVSEGMFGNFRGTGWLEQKLPINSFRKAAKPANTG